ncbi:MAG: sigma-70 family RNA polymerase sigma factor [Saprospiraceae bacterium]
MDAIAPALMSKNENIARTVTKERGRLLNFIRRFVSVSEDAEDILQDVFYQFTAGYDNIRELDKTTSWLFRTARNKITDYFRKKRPERLNMELMRNEDGDTLMLSDILPSLGDTPEEISMRKEIERVIDEALDELPDEQRDVFVMNEVDGMSFREIAEITKQKENTLRSRKRYAIIYLRERLREFYNEVTN